MILTLVILGILYAAGFIYSFVLCFSAFMDNGSEPNPEWGAYSRLLYKAIAGGGHYGGVVKSIASICNSLLWPITLPILLLEKNWIQINKNIM
jgi:hypothetical protein